MWPFKSPKPPPGLTHDEVIKELRDALTEINQCFERLQQAETDITNLNTAVNRVERKQSRWVELLNEKEDPARVALLEGDGRSRQPLSPLPGEETLQGVNYGA